MAMTIDAEAVPGRAGTDRDAMAMRWVGPTTAPMRWPDRLCLPLHFDANALAADLARFERRAWTAHFVQQHYEGDWSALPLRAPAGATHPIMRIAPRPDCQDWVDTELLDASPHIRAALAIFDCALQAVRLMRLAPGSVIKEHRDFDLCAEQGVARLHVPILTNPQVDFRLSGARVEMAPGSLWYLRLSDPHAVANRGTNPRVHLVIDAVVNPWLEALLDAGSAGPPRSVG